MMSLMFLPLAMSAMNARMDASMAIANAHMGMADMVRNARFAVGLGGPAMVAFGRRGAQLESDMYMNQVFEKFYSAMEKDAKQRLAESAKRVDAFA